MNLPLEATQEAPLCSRLPLRAKCKVCCSVQALWRTPLHSCCCLLPSPSLLRVLLPPLSPPPVLPRPRRNPKHFSFPPSVRPSCRRLLTAAGSEWKEASVPVTARVRRCPAGRRAEYVTSTVLVLPNPILNSNCGGGGGFLSSDLAACARGGAKLAMTTGADPAEAAPRRRSFSRGRLNFVTLFEWCPPPPPQFKRVTQPQSL